MGNVARFQQRFSVVQCAHKEQVFAWALKTQEQNELVSLIVENQVTMVEIL
jgi:hypothetical protein